MGCGTSLNPEEESDGKGKLLKKDKETKNGNGMEIQKQGTEGLYGGISMKNRESFVSQQKDSAFLILYATETGNSKAAALRIWSEAKKIGYKPRIMEMCDFVPSNILSEQYVIFVCPTCGQGEFPDDAQSVVEYLLMLSISEDDSTKALLSLNFAVFALGDGNYEMFCEAGKWFDNKLSELGASRLIDRYDGDDQDPEGYVTKLTFFLNELFDTLPMYLEPEIVEDGDLMKNLYKMEVIDKNIEKENEEPTTPSGYSLARMVINDRITPMTHDRDVRHIELDLEGTSITYEPGDTCGIMARNNAQQVEDFLKFYSLDGNLKIKLIPIEEDTPKLSLPPNGLTIRELLSQYLDIFGTPTRHFYEQLSLYAQDPEDKDKLEVMSQNTVKGNLLFDEYAEETATFADILMEFTSARPCLEKLLEIIPIIQPRLYSIASSQSLYPKKLLLCIVLHDWITISGKKRFGHCTGALKDLDPSKNSDIRLAICTKPGTIKFPPSPELPMVMSAQGTGIAPFISFLQERKFVQQQGGKIGEAMLVFGCRHSKMDFLYGDQLREMASQNLVNLQTAFSRDQANKVYIQDRILEQKEFVFKALYSDKGHMYFCGMAGQVPLEIRNTVMNCLMLCGDVDAVDAHSFLRGMDKEGKYMQECWELETPGGKAVGRILRHPVLTIPQREEVPFTWNGQTLFGIKGEALSSALIANGINVFNYHPKDKAPQGLFCANGQCSQCTVVVNGQPQKSCMLPLDEGLCVERTRAALNCEADDEVPSYSEIETIDVDVLIIGGGPAGMCAATQLGAENVKVLLIDDKDRLGGKLVLQTHKFFGSTADCHAGTRGINVGTILEKDMRRHKSVDIWLNSTAVAVFSDKLVGIMKGTSYVLVRPKKLLVATGARENTLTFPGNTIPGVYGAGAFQTLVNRDLVKCSKKILIVGGGNVGVIAGYHAIQAGMEVVALIEALPQVGAFKVHADKLRRLGIPFFTRHTIVAAHGRETLQTVTIGKIDDNFKVIPGTLKSYEVDTLLIAVGLQKCDEFYQKTQKYGIESFVAGDSQEIAEASAAMLTGRIEGRRILHSLGKLLDEEIPPDWIEKAAIMKSKGGPVKTRDDPIDSEKKLATPVFHCYQEIACNACTGVCSKKSISIEGNGITSLPVFDCANGCDACLNCVAICPGLAISHVDYRNDANNPIVTLPCEMGSHKVKKGQMVTLTNDEGEVVGRFKVEKVIQKKVTQLVQFRLPKDIATKVIGVWRQPVAYIGRDIEFEENLLDDDAILCRCERVTVGEVRKAIREGARDANELKARFRIGMGSCQSKVCGSLLPRVFRQEGIPMADITERTDRPLFTEVPLGCFAGVDF